MRGQPLVCAGQDLSIVVTVAASDPIRSRSPPASRVDVARSAGRRTQGSIYLRWSTGISSRASLMSASSDGDEQGESTSDSRCSGWSARQDRRRMPEVHPRTPVFEEVIRDNLDSAARLRRFLRLRPLAMSRIVMAHRPNIWIFKKKPHAPTHPEALLLHWAAHRLSVHRGMMVDHAALGREPWWRGRVQPAIQDVPRPVSLPLV